MKNTYINLKIYVACISFSDFDRYRLQLLSSMKDKTSKMLSKTTDD